MWSQTSHPCDHNNISSATDSSGTLIFPCEEMKSMPSPLKPGWFFVTNREWQKYYHVSPEFRPFEATWFLPGFFLGCSYLGPRGHAIRKPRSHAEAPQLGIKVLPGPQLLQGSQLLPAPTCQLGGKSFSSQLNCPIEMTLCVQRPIALAYSYPQCRFKSKINNCHYFKPINLASKGLHNLLTWTRVPSSRGSGGKAESLCGEARSLWVSSKVGSVPPQPKVGLSG